MSKFIFVFICVALLSCYFQDGAIAADGPSQESEAVLDPTDVKVQIDQIDLKLMLDYIDLSRYNIHFYTKASHHQWWRTWSYPISRESGTATSLAGSITDLSQRARGLNYPGKVSRSSTRKAGMCSLTGNSISGAASALELTQSAWVIFQAQRRGYSAIASVEHVRQAVKETEALLKRREELTATIKSEKIKAMRELEAKVFEQIQEQLLFEFRKWNCFSRELAWRENTFFTLDIIQNFTNATSSLCGLKSYKNPYLRSPAVILSLTSNSIAAANPLIANLVGRAVDKYQKKQLSRDFPLTKPKLSSEISPDSIKALKDAAGSSEDTDLSRVAFLAARAQRLDHSLNRDINSITGLRAIAQQKAISGPLIGMASVTRSIMENVAEFGYGKQKVISTRILFAGRIPQICGQSYAVSNTIATRFLALLKNQKLKAHGDLPAQVFSRRLKDLDNIEAQVRSGKI